MRLIRRRNNIKRIGFIYDDMVILGGNKRELHKMMNEIMNYMKNIHLEVKGDWQIFKVNSRPIDFLGLKFYRNKTILRKRNALRIKRRLIKISKKSRLNYKDACAVVSYWGWIKRSDSYNFYSKNIKPFVTIKQAKRTVSEFAKRRNLRKNPRI
jgi:hypothetical protein